MTPGTSEDAEAAGSFNGRAPTDSGGGRLSPVAVPNSSLVGGPWRLWLARL